MCQNDLNETRNRFAAALPSLGGPREGRLPRAFAATRGPPLSRAPEAPQLLPVLVRRDL